MLRGKGVGIIASAGQAMRTATRRAAATTSGARCPKGFLGPRSLSSKAHGPERHDAFNLIPGTSLRVRKTIRPITACLSSEGWDTSVVRGAAIKSMDNMSALRLRRRAMVRWADGGPSQVLLIKKPKNPLASERLQEIAAWLAARGIKPLVERAVKATEFPKLDAYDPEVHNVDFCITLGGDGTVLHLASLFEKDEPLPPIISFAMGSLGFLTPFDVGDFAHFLTRVLNSAQQPLFCTLRTRKRCEMRHEGKVYVHNVLNEVVIDRGACPNSVLLELFADGHYVTNIEADGLIIATPSGSTAYSMSAGGPMVAPSVPCTILTPIAPLSLSFRPLVIPESSDIIINLPLYARSHGRASFDGKKPLRMLKGTSMTVTTSLCPLPMISMGTLDSDWYEGITHKLKWNQTIRNLPQLPPVTYASVPIVVSHGNDGNGTTATYEHDPLDTEDDGEPGPSQDEEEVEEEEGASWKSNTSTLLKRS